MPDPSAPPKRRPVRQRAGQVFAEASASVALAYARGLSSLRRKSSALFASRNVSSFAGRPAASSPTSNEITRVGHEHQPIAPPVAADLIARCREPCIVVRRLYLDHAAFRYLAFSRAAPLHLLRRIEAEVGMARALVGKFADAEHLRLERRSRRRSAGWRAARSSNAPRSRRRTRAPAQGR